MKKVAGGLRLDLASFRELEAFAQLGTDLDAATQQRLDRGYRMVELLKQGQFAPMDMVDQVMSIYAGTRGHLDDVKREDVADWEKGFLTFIRDQVPELRTRIDQSKELDGESERQLEAAIAEYKRQRATKAGGAARQLAGAR
jgi:F-type H+-transporting ATPase subunit alpha